MAAYEVLLLNTAIPQIQAAQSGDTYVVPRDIAFSTVANLANGTNLLPSLTFSSDTNTGIYREGADALGFTAGGGTNQMVLTSTGLGIGTSSPNAKLDVNGITQSRGNLYGGVANTVSNIIAYANVATGGAGTSQFLFGNTSSDSRGYFSYSHASDTLLIGTAGATQATLSASGNLGLGVTPSAWGSSNRAFQVATAGAIWSPGGTDVRLSNNQYRDSVNSRIYIANGYAQEYAQDSSGNHVWLIAPSGTAGNAISFTQAMTLDASGNLLVGTTSALLSGAGRGNITVNGTSDAIVVFGNNGASSGYIYSSSSKLELDASGSRWMQFNTNGTERARITSGGYFKASNDGTYVGSTGAYHELRTNAADYVAYITNNNASSPYGFEVTYTGTDPNGTGNRYIGCYASSTQKMEVRSNGGIANYQANDVNLSDRREKTNFAPAKSYLDIICSIPVQTFNYIDQSKDDPGLTLGVVAQDVQAVAPELVSESNWGTEDNPKMRLSIYQTDLQYALMKCIQEQQAMINELKAEVAALKGA